MTSHASALKSFVSYMSENQTSVIRSGSNLGVQTSLGISIFFILAI